MKKGIVLTLIGLSVLWTSCGGNSEKKEDVDTSADVETRDSNGLKIAYYNQDSLKLYFDYYREQDSIITKKQLAFQNEVQRRTAELENYIIRNDERARSGLLSENEIIQIQQAVQQKEAALMEYQQREGSKIEEATIRELEVIGNKIQHFGEKYCEENSIDILLVQAAGGQINFIHESMDVTKEFTNYLNQNQEDLVNDIEK